LDTPAINDGSTGAQFFVGTQTQVCDIYGCKTDSEFLRTLQENVRLRGAPTKLHKRHTALSFHKVREAVASGLVIFTHIPGTLNVANILSKHWDYGTVWKLLRPLLFWKGDPADIPAHDNSRQVGIQDQAQPPDLVPEP
jgi:hypothetical protein